MLTETLRENLTTLYGASVRTKATKFGSMYSTVPKSDKDKSDYEKVFVSLKTGVEKQIKARQNITESDSVDSEYIIEDPNQVIVDFSTFKSSFSENKLPFFRSLQIKLFNV